MNVSMLRHLSSSGSEKNRPSRVAEAPRNDDGASPESSRHPTFLPGHGLLLDSAKGDAGVKTSDAEHNDDGHHAAAHNDEEESICSSATKKWKKMHQKKKGKICSTDNLLNHKSEFFLIQEVTSGKFLARPLDTNKPSCGCRDKIFRIKPVKKDGKVAFTVQGRNRMFLSFEHNDRLTVNRLWALSYEAWMFHFDADGSSCTFTMQSNAPPSINNRYVSLLKSTRALETADDTPHRAAKWRIIPLSRGSSKDDHDEEHDDENDGGHHGHVDDARHYWGLSGAMLDEEEEKKRQKDCGNKGCEKGPYRGPLHDSADTLPELRKAVFPLFGSPKPLSSSKPVDPNSKYDTVVIAERTIRNWAAMDGMQPVMFSTDKNTLAIVDKVNREVDEHNAALRSGGCDPVEEHVPRHMRRHRTKVSADFETMPAYKNNPPTYRGLFKKALEMHPDAPAVMYSNGDILFSPTLAQTIRFVASVYEREKRRREQHQDDNDDDDGTGKKKTKKQLRGWMIVGQRINYEVPASFTLKDLSDETYASCGSIKKLVDESNSNNDKNSNFSALETLLPKWVDDVERFGIKGKLFQGNAEDYFIVSRDLFDWDKVPAFIVGGVAFDNWITSRGVRMALSGEAIMVDAVKTITALHQNDDPNVKQSHKTDKSKFNLRLAAQHGGIGNGYTSDAPLATEKLPDGSVTIYDKYALLFS